MYRSRLNPTILAIVIAAATSGAIAEETHHHEAHVHGEAELQIVLEGQALQIQLKSPAANLVGFEHAPRNDEQKDKVKDAQAALNDAGALFSFTNADCTLSSQESDFGDLVEESHDDHHDEDDHDSHHEDEHDSHHDDDEHDESHTEITSTYRFECDDAENLTGLSTTLTSRFEGMETVNVQWIVSSRQGAAELSKSKTELTF